MQYSDGDGAASSSGSRTIRAAAWLPSAASATQANPAVKSSRCTMPGRSRTPRDARILDQHRPAARQGQPQLALHAEPPAHPDEGDREAGHQTDQEARGGAEVPEVHRIERVAHRADRDRDRGERDRRDRLDAEVARAGLAHGLVSPGLVVPGAVSPGLVATTRSSMVIRRFFARASSTTPRSIPRGLCPPPRRRSRRGPHSPSRHARPAAAGPGARACYRRACTGSRGRAPPWSACGSPGRPRRRAGSRAGSSRP